jgi:DNA-binding HxlR family transcriptional regulator
MEDFEIPEKKDAACTGHLRSIHDTLDIISGKWKITIIGSLNFGKKRFMELQREVEGIGAKMLSKELRELEINGLIKRTVYDTKPVTVEYEITEYGKTLSPIIYEMAKWGAEHRKKIMSKELVPELISQ